LQGRDLHKLNSSSDPEHKEKEFDDGFSSHDSDESYLDYDTGSVSETAGVFLS